MKSTRLRMAAVAVLLPPVLAGIPAQAACTLPSDPATLLGIVFPLVDTNRDDGLSLAELTVLYAGIPAEYYNFVDTNRDGKVTLAEITPFLPLVNSLLPGGNLLSYVDTNGNGTIEYAEVSQYVTPAQFALLDKDGNLVIDCTDIANITPPAEGEPAEGETPPPPTAPCALPADYLPGAAELAVSVVDTDHSGGLSLAEILAVYPVPAEYQSLFGLIDANASGQVEPQEIVSILGALGVDLLGEIDVSGDRMIQYAEVSEYVSSAQFSLLDRNGNGVLDCGDLPAAVICPLPEGVVTSAARLLVLVFDSDGSGGLGFSELMMLSSQPAENISIIDTDQSGEVDAEELVASAIAQQMQLLDRLDLNHDGAVQYTEVEGRGLSLEKFALVDLNGDRVFDCHDLDSVAEGELVPPVCPLPADVVSVLAKMLIPLFDADQSGGLSLAEINAVYPVPSEYATYFPVIDLNQDGQIEAEEVVSVLSMLNVDPLALIDGNSDRIVQYSEVSGYVTAGQFALLDRNGNGAFDCGDLTMLAPEGESEGETALPCAIPNVNSLMLDAVFALLDANHDGGIAMEEVTGLVPGMDTATLQTLFTLLGAGGNGKISRAALDTVLSLLPALGVNLPSIPNVSGMGILSLIDTNGDGLIQLSEVSPYLNASVFAMLDTNANGVLDCEDLNALLNGFGPEGEPPIEGEPPVEGELTEYCPLPPDAVFPIAVRLVDLNGDGGISLAEMQAVVPQAPAQLFLLADTNGDGLIDAAELKALASTPVIQTLLPVPGPNDLLGMVDTNRNGVIEYGEISGVFTQERFAAADTNRNGVIDCEDLGVAPPAEGEPSPEGEPPVEGEPGEYCPLPPDSVCAVAIRMVDLDGNGSISLNEMQTTVPQAPAQLFTMADANGDGKVDEAELRVLAANPPILALMGAVMPSDLLGLVDTNSNGVIEFSEVSPVIPRDRFNVADTNSNGVIDCEDLTTAPPAEGEPSSEGEIGSIDDLLQHLHGSGNLAGLMTDAFGLLDTNGDGALSYAEISARIKLPRAVFNAADTDGNGLVTMAELSALAQQAVNQPGAVIELAREIVGRFGNQFFAPGDVIRVTLRLIKHGDGVLSQLRLLEALPEGWVIRLISGAEGVSAKSVAGNALVLDWSDATAFPLQIVYEATAPANASGLVTVTGQADYEMADGGAESTGAVASVLAEALPEELTHTADADHDWHLSLSEVLRVVQLYNSGGYSAETGTEDGYLPGGGKQAGVPHDADCNGDWSIDISELLRVVQLFNAPGGAYYCASGTEDGFVPGIF